jgi:hypothetical protein
VVALGLVCTALAFVAFFELIKEVGSTRATVITYLNPAVAVVLGVVFLGEAFKVGTGVGFALILAGSWLATGPRGNPAGPAAKYRAGGEAAAPSPRGGQEVYPAGPAPAVTPGAQPARDVMKRGLEALG